MTNYTDIYKQNVSKTMVKFDLCDKNTIRYWDKYSNNYIRCTEEGLKSFNDEFYIPLFNYLTSFPNVFKLLDMLEKCFDSHFVRPFKNIIINSPASFSQFKLYEKVFPVIQVDINNKILSAILTGYFEEDVDINSTCVDKILSGDKELANLFKMTKNN